MSKITPLCLLPRGLLPLHLDLLLDLGLLVELVEVVHDDRDREGDAEDAADCTRCKASL